MDAGIDAAAVSDRDVRFHAQQARFDASGKSVIEFCREEGVAVSTFYQRRARLKKRLQSNQPVAPRGASFIDVGAVVLPSAARKASPSPAAARLEVRLELGNGLVLHVSRN